MGKPKKSLATTNVGRQNLTMRMLMRRFTRSTIGFSEKLDNRFWMLLIYFVYYNFCRIHGSMRTTPAMEAGHSDSVRDIGLIMDVLETKEATVSHKRGTYKKWVNK